MQQTEKYKLNLIEPSDPFLPDALNANTQQLEEVVSEHLEAMDQRVTVLEGLKVAYGAYWGDGTYPRFIPLPFTPRYVSVVAIVTGASRSYASAAVDAVGGDAGALKISEGGFTIYEDNYSPLNSGHYYGYLAIS